MIKNILIMTYAKLGDSFVLVPSINLIREKFPDARIDFFSEKYSTHNINAKYALQDTGLIDNFYLFTSDRSKYPKKIEKLFWLPRFRLHKYDCVFVLLPMGLSVVKRFERDIKIIGANKFFLPLYPDREIKDNKLIEKPPVIWYLFKKTSKYLADNFNVEQENNITQYLYYKKIKSKKNFIKKSIGICMGTDMSVKKWDKDNFYQVLNLISKKHYDIDFLFIGTTKDAAEMDYIINKLGKGKKAINLSIAQLYEKIYQECFMYLGVDTGIMHLFNLAQIPIIGLFSARDVPGKWYPYGVKNYIFREYIECEGCILKECDIENSCMNRIKVENVYKKVDEFIKEIKG